MPAPGRSQGAVGRGGQCCVRELRGQSAIGPLAVLNLLRFPEQVSTYSTMVGR